MSCGVLKDQIDTFEGERLRERTRKEEKGLEEERERSNGLEKMYSSQLMLGCRD